MYFTHRFETQIEVYDYGTYFYTVIYLPDEIATSLPFGSGLRLRVEAEIDGVPLEATLLPDRLGSTQTNHLVDRLGREGDRIWYMIVAQKILKQISKGIDETVEVRMRVADQHAVNIPPALEEALDGDAEFAAAWNRLTPGKRRGHAHRVASAKRQDTIDRRIQEIRDALGL